MGVGLEGRRRGVGDVVERTARVRGGVNGGWRYRAAWRSKRGVEEGGAGGERGLGVVWEWGVGR